MKVSDIGEIGLIQRLTRGIKLDRSVIKGAGDDTAVIEWTPKKYLLYTCDMLVEDVHFTRRAATPLQVGWKALGRNISDIAAMGGKPRYAVVSLALPGRTRVSYADGIYTGMKKLASKFGVNIVGGDISRSDKIIIDVSLIGEVEKKHLATRCGARCGDTIFVTGSLGGSIKGKHLDFTPRVKEARALVTRYEVNSMIDISDGLILDLWRILDASGAGARIFEAAVPLSPAAASFEKAVRDGEDFELLFTVGAADTKRLFKASLEAAGTPVTPIGEITAKRDGYRLMYADGSFEKIRAKGFLHF